MPVDVADVIEDHCVFLARRWTQHTAHLLQVEAERLRGPEQDGAAGGWDIESFADYVDGDENADAMRGKVGHDLLAVWSIA